MRLSLEALKAKAQTTTLTETMDKITGGAKVGCHPVSAGGCNPGQVGTHN